MIEFPSDCIQAAFWFAFTVAAFLAANAFNGFLNRKFGVPKFAVLYIAAAVVALAVEISGGDYAEYKKGGDWASWFLYPATVSLAVPLYKNRREILKSLPEVAAATVVSCIVSVSSIWLFAKFFKMDDILAKSLLPKCVTTPVAIEIANMTAGLPEIAVFAVCFMGICGVIFGHTELALLGIKDDVSVGLSMGATSHVIGTAKCLERSQRQGAAGALVLITCALFSAAAITLVFG